MKDLSNQELIFIVNAVSEFRVKDVPEAKIKGDILSKISTELLTPPSQKD